jgi:hypothetical protein
MPSKDFKKMPYLPEYHFHPLHRNPNINIFRDHVCQDHFDKVWKSSREYEIISYCLDGQEPTPISGNTTLTDLANGQHKATVYATDEFDYTGVSDILFFNVNLQKLTHQSYLWCLSSLSPLSSL